MQAAGPALIRPVIEIFPAAGVHTHTGGRGDSGFGLYAGNHAKLVVFMLDVGCWPVCVRTHAHTHTLNLCTTGTTSLYPMPQVLGDLVVYDLAHETWRPPVTQTLGGSPFARGGGALTWPSNRSYACIVPLSPVKFLLHGGKAGNRDTGVSKRCACACVRARVCVCVYMCV